MDIDSIKFIELGMKNWIYIQFFYEYDELADVLAELDDQNLQLPIRQPGSPNDVSMVRQ